MDEWMAYLWWIFFVKLRIYYTGATNWGGPPDETAKTEATCDGSCDEIPNLCISYVIISVKYSRVRQTTNTPPPPPPKKPKHLLSFSYLTLDAYFRLSLPPHHILFFISCDGFGISLFITCNILNIGQRKRLKKRKHCA